jgi:hypothetical protein
MITTLQEFLRTALKKRVAEPIRLATRIWAGWNLPSRSRTRTAKLRFILLGTALLVFGGAMFASDHADPIDLLHRKRLEPDISDLFLFPVLANDEAAFPFNRTDKISLAYPDLKPRRRLTAEQQAKITHFVIILCVRPMLTQTSSLVLEPYEYRIHIDTKNTVAYLDEKKDRPAASPGFGGGYQPKPGKGREPMTIEESRARYGGMVDSPESIDDDIVITIALHNDASLRDITFKGLRDATRISKYKRDPDVISIWTGVRDDPFIFPAFFGTNVVAMVLSIPVKCFPPDSNDWLIWATSHEGSRQHDHVGRSLRTQNPRFEILNTLHPRDHVAAIRRADEDPTLVRDLGLRSNLQGLAAFRRWDFVPDVMIYKRDIPVGLPNGRLIYDDVAAILAQFGDTALLELSHQHPNGTWPRRTINDKPFFHTTDDKPHLAKFPYLAEPWPDKEPSPPPMLTAKNQAKLAVVPSGAVIVLALIMLGYARLYHRRKVRRRYL